MIPLLIWYKQEEQLAHPICELDKTPSLCLCLQKRAQYTRELADLPAERTVAQNEQRLSSQIAGLMKQLEYKAVDLKATEEKLGKLAGELQTLAQARRQPCHTWPARQAWPERLSAMQMWYQRLVCHISWNWRSSDCSFLVVRERRLRPRSCQR